jgi:hypothetical protein
MTVTQTVSQMMEEIETLLDLFNTVRENVSEEQWDEWNDHPQLSKLLDAISDIEYTVG